MRALLWFAIALSAPVLYAQPATAPTPAEQRIAAAKQRLAADDKHPEPYTDLALAYIRRARETGDAAWLGHATEALAAGRRIAPGDFQLAKAQAALLLAQEQWKPALELAQALNRRTPDDVTVYGYIAQAELALGEIDKADQAAQWMMNLRPNNIAALMIGADLRVVYRDVPGALEFLGQAYSETPQIEPEEQAWIANRMAEIELDAGQLDAAGKALVRAESLFPAEPLWSKTRVRLEQARQANAGPALRTSADPLAALQPESIVGAAATPALTHDPGGVPKMLLIPRPTATARNVKKYQALVSAGPDRPDAYASLGAAYLQRARESGDVEDYSLAEQALQKSLAMLSNDLAAAAPLATMAEVCMGEHRFTDALDYAQRALALGSGDLSAFAIVGDAYADMGEYAKAAAAYRRMQPIGSNVSHRTAYAEHTREAYLAFIAGDSAGAITGMQAALAEALDAHVPGENLAWLYYELGEFSFLSGRLAQAGDAYYTALSVFPGDYRALAGLAKVRAAAGALDDAIGLYQAAINVVPMPAYIEELGDVYARAGRAGEAEKQYRLVEYIGRLGRIQQVLHNRDLALYYADHDRNPAEALALAHKEFEVRSDIYTWDALAWALYRNGKYADAQAASEHALGLGTRDALLLFHSGMIAARLGHTEQAVQQLDEALAINPHFHVLFAEQATGELTVLRKGAATLAQAGPRSGAQARIQPGASPTP